MSLTVPSNSLYSLSPPFIPSCAQERIDPPYSFLETSSFPQIEPFIKSIQGKDRIDVHCLNKILKIASREENSIIRAACTKERGYISRLFSKETWEEWTEYKTDLGKVMGLFFHYLGHPVRPEVLLSHLPEVVLVNANAEAKTTLCLLSKEEPVQSSSLFFPRFFSILLADAAPLEKLANLVYEIREKVTLVTSADLSKELLLRAIGTQLKGNDTAMDPAMDPEILKALSYLINLAGTIIDPSEFYNNLISGEIENIILERLKDLEADINKHREIPEKLRKIDGLIARLNKIKEEMKTLLNEIKSASHTEKGINEELAKLESDLADFRANLNACKQLVDTKTALITRIAEQEKYIQTGEDYLTKAMQQAKCSSLTNACLLKFSKEIQQQLISFKNGIPDMKERMTHNQGELKKVEENLERSCKKTEKEYSNSRVHLSTYLLEIKNKLATLTQKKEQLEAQLQAAEKELSQIKEEL